MKIAELLTESFEDELEIVDDPDTDKVPHIVMQFKKSIDNGNRSPIMFKDGDKVSIPMNIIVDFLNRYDDLKPFEREELQKTASASYDGFKDAMSAVRRKTMPKSNYVR